jgi:uncharacterized membrane protein YccC
MVMARPRNANPGPLRFQDLRSAPTNPTISRYLSQMGAQTRAIHRAIERLAETVEAAEKELSPNDFTELESRTSHQEWFISVHQYLDGFAR